MVDCKKCNKQLLWVSDEEDRKGFYTLYICIECNKKVKKYFI